MVKQICQNCGKGTMRAARHRHGRGVASKKFEQRAQKTKRVLKPNLHWSRVVVKGVRKRMYLCTKCMRKLKRSMVAAAPLLAKDKVKLQKKPGGEKKAG